MRVLLAVSGGPDSMTMADKCVSHCRFDSIPSLCEADFAVAHCNFHLRPGDCDLDAELVEKWASDHSLPFFKADFDTEKYCMEHGVSIETGARELRYRWFAEICEVHGYDCVAVAHNANDNAETLILNLVRGTGIKGAAGMTPEDVMPYSDGRIKLLRPLLDMTRAEIEAWASERGIRFRVDHTNLDSEYKRNFIRNEVLPLLERLNPSLIRTLNTDMSNFSMASEALQDWVSEKVELVTGDDGSIDVDALLEQKSWEYVLFDILSARGFAPSVYSDMVKHVSMTYRGDKGKTFSGRTFYGESMKAVTGRGRIFFTPAVGGNDDNILITGPGEWIYGNATIRVEVRQYDPEMPLKCPAGVIQFDADRFRFPFLCRRWKEGDWFIPLGMRGRKKLSDFFSDRHLSLIQKQNAVVLCSPDASDGRVLAITEMRIDDSIRISEKTKTVVSVTL